MAFVGSFSGGIVFVIDSFIDFNFQYQPLVNYFAKVLNDRVCSLDKFEVI